MGAVLSQIDTEGQEHPVGYYSRKLNEAERKWDIWETELAATVWATMTCRHHLRTVHFELVTDSKVVAMMLKKEAPKRRENWIVRLFEFNFTVVHRKGELNRNADFFSRWATYRNWKDEKDLKECHTDIIVNELKPTQQESIAVLKLFTWVLWDSPPPQIQLSGPHSAAAPTSKAVVAAAASAPSDNAPVEKHA